MISAKVPFSEVYLVVSKGSGGSDPTVLTFRKHLKITHKEKPQQTQTSGQMDLDWHCGENCWYTVLLPIGTGLVTHLLSPGCVQHHPIGIIIVLSRGKSKTSLGWVVSQQLLTPVNPLKPPSNITHPMVASALLA